MKKRIARALEHDTPLTRFVAWWFDCCDYRLGRKDEWMALAYICERVLLALAGLWWVYGHHPHRIGDCLYAICLLPVVVLARRKR